MTRITRADVERLAADTAKAVQEGRTTVGYGQVSIKDARAAIVMGLWLVRKKERKQQLKEHRKQARDQRTLQTQTPRRHRRRVVVEQD